MLKWLITLALLSLKLNSNAQYATASVPYKPAGVNERQKTKPVFYNTIGYCYQLDKRDLVIGGTSVVYKKFGTFLSYKVGVRNWMLPENGEAGQVTYENVQKNSQSSAKWGFTGNEQRAVTFMLSGGLTIPITKKIPLYFGAGGTRYRAFFEYFTPFDSTTLWNINKNRTGFELNYTAGMIIPIGRFLINVGYDHNPQSIFIGIGIGGRYVYEDVDEWWWGNNK